MSRFSDETLMAYADGALPPAEAAEVAAALESDAEARAVVERFRSTATLARAAFADMAAEPVPDTLVRTVLGTEAPAASATNFPPIRKTRPPLWRTMVPLAASIALVLGLAAALFLRQPPAVLPGQIMVLGPVPSGAALAEILETRPSGTPVALQERDAQGSEHLMIVATLRDRNGRICREVEALDKAMQARLAGIACRDSASRTWIVEGTARIAASSPSGGSDFVPSGVDQKDALDGLLSILGATKALPPEEEQRLIANGWW